MPDQSPVKVVKKALDALDCIAEHSVTGQGITLGQIAATLGIQPTTARNILRTMETCGYVARTGNKLYCPGPKCGSLSRGSIASSRLLQAAQVPLSALAHRTGEALVLTTMINGKRLVLLRANGDEPIRVSPELLEQKSVYSMVTTRIMLAFADPDEVDLFVKNTGMPGKAWDNIKTRENLLAVLEDIRAAGFAEHVSKSGVAQVAFPVTCDRKLVAALGMHLPAFRYDDGRRKLLFKDMKNSAAEIANRI